MITRDQAIRATQEALDAAEKAASRLEGLCARLADSLPLDDATDLPDELFERSHALMHLVEQIYDLIARRLFRGALRLVEEDAASMSARNVMLRIEQLGALSDMAAWQRILGIRNTLVHDYPTTDGKLTTNINLAWSVVDDLLRALRDVATFLRSEGGLA